MSAPITASLYDFDTVNCMTTVVLEPHGEQTADRFQIVAIGEWDGVSFEWVDSPSWSDVDGNSTDVLASVDTKCLEDIRLHMEEHFRDREISRAEAAMDDAADAARERKLDCDF